jgi:hypothetical protein
MGNEMTDFKWFEALIAETKVADERQYFVKLAPATRWHEVNARDYLYCTANAGNGDRFAIVELTEGKR